MEAATEVEARDSAVHAVQCLGATPGSKLVAWLCKKVWHMKSFKLQGLDSCACGARIRSWRVNEGWNASGHKQSFERPFRRLDKIMMNDTRESHCADQMIFAKLREEVHWDWQETVGHCWAMSATVRDGCSTKFLGWFASKWTTFHHL